MKKKKSQGPQPPRAHGEIDGLPSSLPGGALVALIENGTAIAVAHGELLTIYRLVQDGERAYAREQGRQRLPGTASALAESSLGIVAVVEGCEGSHLCIASRERVISIASLPGIATALAVAGSHAYVVSRDGGSRQGRLIQVDLRQREVVSERSLEHAAMQLSVDHAGSRLVLSDPKSSRVTILDPSAGLRPIRIPRPILNLSNGRDAATSGREREATHQHGCCCMVCTPDPGTGGSGTDTPSSPQDPTRPTTPPTNGQQGPQRPGDDGSGHDGQVGVPAPGGGTVVGNGTSVDHHPPGGLGGGPCGRNLFWEVAKLDRSMSYFLASDRSGQHVALLSADMNLIEEWKFGRGGAMVLASETSPTVVMHVRSLGQWIKHDIQTLVSARIDLGRYLLQPEVSKTFIGQKFYTMSYGQAGAPTSINAVLLPIIEGDQVYSSPDLSGFAAFVHRAMEPVVRDYYQENSFGILKDVNIKVFGTDVGPVGVPLKLPRNKLSDYYFPDYIPAAAVVTRSGVNPADKLTFDGSETVTLNIKPLSGGGDAATLVLPFFAFAFQKQIDYFPYQVKFLGTEKLTMGVTTPVGGAKTLVLNFTAKTIDLTDPGSLPAKLSELQTYLDGVMQAAEAAAGISPRLFASPTAMRIPELGKDFGRLLVKFVAANQAGAKLVIQSATGTAPGGDTLGIKSAILGSIRYDHPSDLQQYLEIVATLGQEANPSYGYNNRILAPPSCTFDAGPATLTTAFAISDRFGGPGARVALVDSAGLDALIDVYSPRDNSATTKNDQHAPQDFYDLLRDAFSAAIERLRGANLPTDALNSYGTIMLMPVETPTAKFGVLPSENWQVTPLNRPFYLRGEEMGGTVVDRKDESIQAQSTWALVFMRAKTDDLNTSVICHEQGHALGFGDLYSQVGYRDDLAYLEDWSLMDNDGQMSHHCGYHKLQANWIPDGSGTIADYGRVYPFGLPLADTKRVEEVLLVSLEIWRDSLAASSRAAFGVGNDFPVVQLVYIDLGGDGATFGLIEAREHAKFSAGHLHFNQNIPGDGGILITNAISYKLDDRFAVNGFYRRNCQLLNPSNILRNPGDVFDLALAPEFPVKGMTVEVVDRTVVEGDTEVYRVKISRENAEFVDLYFDPGDPYYKSPDLWVSHAADLSPDYPIGQPTDQGASIFTPDQGVEPYWMVARVRNRGQVDARDVKMNFYYLEPPGGGDGRKPLNTKTRDGLKLVKTITTPSVAGGNAPIKVGAQWDIAAGFSGHTCLLVEIEDLKVPRDSKGAALGTSDQWEANNHAQKNVQIMQAPSQSPFDPIEFDFSVYNGGLVPETAYLEPQALPYGMKLTVTPPVRKIAAGETAIYHCKLELDEKIIRTGCENDQRFRIHAWRQDPESSVRWGGVEYEVQPRLKTVATLKGTWDYGNQIDLKGSVVPNPGGGGLRIRLAFDGKQSYWVSAPLSASGTFAWSGLAPSGSSALNAVALFDGNRKYSLSRSAPLDLTPPTPIK